jgi:Neuraminidase (sialidase)
MIGLDLGLWRGQAAGFNPLNLSPALWFDASDSTTLFQSNGGAAAAADGDPVGYWLDKSGNGRHLTQTSGINKPLLKLAIKNGKNGVLFNGTSSFFNATSYTHPSAMTFFRVIKRTTAATRSFGISNSTGVDYPAWWDFDNKLYLASSGRVFVQTSTSTSTGFFILKSFYSSASDLACWVNGASVAGSIAGTAGVTLAWTLYGKAAAGYSNDYVFEDLAFPSALSAGDVANVESYLNSKWAVY